MKNVAIDSDVIVSSEIKKESNHIKSKEFMNEVLSNKIKGIYFFTSIFTFLELASAMKRRTKNKDKTYSLIYRITKSWKDKINPLPFSSLKKQISPKKFSTNIIDDWIETAIKFNSKSGDTIQIHSLIENQIDCFITWNKKDFILLERKIEDFEVLTPTEFLSKINNFNLNKNDTPNTN